MICSQILAISVAAIGVLATSSHNRIGSSRDLQGQANSLHARKDGFVKKRHLRRTGNKKRSCSAPSSSPAAAAASPTSTGSSWSSGSSYNSGSNSGSSSNSTSGSNSSSGSSDSSGSLSSLSSLGITHWMGTNSGIGSWFRTDNSNDDTNGRSWCQTNYQDSWVGFAPDVSSMLSDFGGDLAKAATAYCGLEAKATDPSTGNSVLMYVVDGFDPQWVRSAGSVDLTLAAFAALYGSTTTDKDTVIMNLQWEWTGNRNSQYGYNGQ